jgi:hypothetical protein
MMVLLFVLMVRSLVAKSRILQMVSRQLGMGRKVVLVGKIQGTQKDLERMINEVEMGMMGIENIHKGLLNNSN